MLTDIVRKSLDRVNNRFEVVMITAERCRQLLLGARPTVDNPARERMTKVAMREIVEGRVRREADGWRIDRPAMPELFTTPPGPTREEEELLGLHERARDEEDDEDVGLDDEE